MVSCTCLVFLNVWCALLPVVTRSPVATAPPTSRTAKYAPALLPPAWHSARCASLHVSKLACIICLHACLHVCMARRRPAGAVV